MLPPSASTARPDRQQRLHMLPPSASARWRVYSSNRNHCLLLPTSDPADSEPLRRWSVVGLHSALDDFQKVTDQVPFLADLKPRGNARNNFPMTDPMGSAGANAGFWQWSS
ncbi:hypothetical protein C2845_PM13G24650 [Panicum miliaceum]|uniref:Uncharacterized protein n=1 Tax=Panicum miliaceum TaxID=4540 RepID=A0A3L6RJQ9_PANMI|nr:hypothetical protein C2845_PM13G24650 [Panicum miliaceum]